VKWTEGEETRNGSPFESRKKALKRRSYGISSANDAKRDSSFATGKDKKRGPGEGSGIRPGLDNEDNDVQLCFAKTRSKIPRFKCFLEILIHILFGKASKRTRVFVTKIG